MNRFLTGCAALAFCGVLAGVGAVSASAAQEPAAGQDSFSLSVPVDITVSGIRLGPAPDPGQAIQVRVMDDSAANLRLKAWVEQALSLRGLKTGGPEAPLLLTLDTSGSVPSPLPEPNRTLPVLLHGQMGGMRGEDDVSVGLRLYSSNEASVLGGRATAEQPVRGSPGHKIHATLTDRASNRQVWTGTAAIGENHLGDQEKLLLMARPLAEEVGQDNRHHVITVPSGPVAMPPETGSQTPGQQTGP
ncbi:hypothetical protein IHV25_09245 [Phaeovibrio sulfidiphilus]|uniref:Uncharacterized protein n=1 Tax=Phaeovibrio sulfidiphilus TaxID=1220600 RepID=A0A8J7CWR5_9PROT|nr:hypothetical protein [Phaeovibrio sulfidiphilus]MBE1237831.1 hypothetical protein [Phaeovibrio sulfidiphilus]